MDQLNFKNWIEAVQLVRGYQDSHNVSLLGKLGWWTVYSAKQPNKTGQIGGGSMGYNFSQQPDHLVVGRDSHVRPVFEEAAQRLASLGFPRMHANVVIVNLDDVPNPIDDVPNPSTGGGVGGQAWNKKHGFTVDRTHINVDIIIHEHAHMYWFNLPKPSQAYFQKYYREAISQKTIDPKDMWKHSGASFDPKGLDKAIEASWSSFEEDLGYLIGHRLESFFNIQNAIESGDESRLIESTILTRFNSSCMAVAKKSIPMERPLGGYQHKTVEAGDHVKVEHGAQFIISQRNGEVQWDYPEPMEREELHEWVTFKPELLYENQLEKYKSTVKMAKDKPSRFFAPHKKKEEIEKIFERATEEISDKFGFEGKSYYPTTFSAKQLFPYAKFYQTWMSRIGRRFKAGKITNMEGLKQVYIDSMKSQAKGDLSAAPDNMSGGEMSGKGYDYANIGSEKGSKLRDLIHQQGTTPSAYGAANIDELWAVSVEHAAMGQNVSKELKKLIYSTITGTAM